MYCVGVGVYFPDSERQLSQSALISELPKHMVYLYGIVYITLLILLIRPDMTKVQRYIPVCCFLYILSDLTG